MTAIDVTTDVHREQDLDSVGINATVKAYNGTPHLVTVLIDPLDLDRLIHDFGPGSERFSEADMDGADETGRSDGRKDGYTTALHDIEALASTGQPAQKAA